MFHENCGKREVFYIIWLFSTAEVQHTGGVKAFQRVSFGFQSSVFMTRREFFPLSLHLYMYATSFWRLKSNLHLMTSSVSLRFHT